MTNRTRILQRVHAGETTAVEIADAVGCHESTARKWLKHLEGEGLVECEESIGNSFNSGVVAHYWSAVACSVCDDHYAVVAVEGGVLCDECEASGAEVEPIDPSGETAPTIEQEPECMVKVVEGECAKCDLVEHCPSCGTGWVSDSATCMAVGANGEACGVPKNREARKAIARAAIRKALGEVRVSLVRAKQVSGEATCWVEALQESHGKLVEALLDLAE